jgi:hypothetical protein
MIQELIDVRARLKEILKGKPKEIQDLAEVCFLIGHAEFLSELCQWGAKEASFAKPINHFSVIAFASEQELKLKSDLRDLGVLK